MFDSELRFFLVEEEPEKPCWNCSVMKPLTEFYKCKGNRDGRFGKCSKSMTVDVIKNRNKNLDYYREYDRKRGSRQPYSHTLQYRTDYPKKYKAHQLINNHIRDGKLRKQPCEVCDTTERVHAHHDDYDKPLEVRWLCAGHHRQWHVKYGEAKNPK